MWAESLLNLVTMMEDASAVQGPATGHEVLDSDHQYPITELARQHMLVSPKVGMAHRNRRIPDMYWPAIQTS